MNFPKVYFFAPASSRSLSALTGFDFSEYETSSPGGASHLVVSHHQESMAAFLQIVDDRHTTLFLAGEAEFPDFNLFDFAIGFDLIELTDRYVRPHPTQRFRNWVETALDVWPDKGQLPIGEREFFCDFIYSNNRAHEMRREIFFAIDAIKKVQSWGRVLNNTNSSLWRDSWDSDWRAKKLRIQSRHRFSLSLENSQYRGYTSEKILSSMLTGSIPIYWGNTEIEKDFNPERFINAHKYESLDALAGAVTNLDSDRDALAQMVSHPIMNEEQLGMAQSVSQEMVKLCERFLDSRGAKNHFRGSGTIPWAYLRRKKLETQLLRPIVHRAREWVIANRK